MLDCDVVYCPFWKRIGEFTLEEFLKAWENIVETKHAKSLRSFSWYYFDFWYILLWK